jgi:hypothetical protein
MKIEVKEVEKSPNSKYPKLMYMDDKRVILLATGETEGGLVRGMIIHSLVGVASDVGAYDEGWVLEVEDFNGTITLSNN